MYQVPPHPSASTVRSIAALVVVMVMVLVFCLSLTDLRQDGAQPLPQPLPAGATLVLQPRPGHATGGLES